MRLLLSRSRRQKKQYNVNLYVLSIIGLCFGISVSSWRYNTFYANGASTTRRSSNKQSIMQCSSSSSSETDRKDADYYSERSSDSAKFSLSGSICGQNREYLLENLNCRDDCEIQFCGPTSHQAVLKWTTPPKRVLLLSKPDTVILAALVNCLPYLVEKGLELYVEDTVYDELIQMTNPENEENNTDKDLIDGDRTIVSGRLAKNTKLNVFNKNSPRKQGVDLVIAFGGDGLLMHCNTLFGGGSIPPSMCFDFGSLGFLAPFDYKDFELEVDRVLIGPVFLTLRMRLHGRIIRTEEEIGSFHILNEIVIDRGPSPFLAIIDLECDQQYLTTVQGDGIIVATPTGSTAYSLAAGGSMVHPSVPAILLTPICAHTLSFRPLLLPDSSVLMCSIPVDCRSSGWVSFDGKFRQELLRGDSLEVKLSDYPMPTINRQNFTGDWFDALRSSFMFNVRPRQKAT